MNNSNYKAGQNGKIRPISNAEEIKDSSVIGSPTSQEKEFELPPIAIKKNIQRFNSFENDSSVQESSQNNPNHKDSNSGASPISSIHNKGKAKEEIGNTMNEPVSALVNGLKKESESPLEDKNEKQAQIKAPADQTAGKGNKSISELLKDAGDKDDSDDEKKDKDFDPASKFESHGKTFTFSKKSLWLFSHTNCFRLKVIQIITHKWFDNIIMSIIILNSLFLGMIDYQDEFGGINNFINETEIYFNVAFFIECTLKVIGMGFVMDPGSYLRDAWNWLDFMVVVSSLLTEIPQMKSVSGLRTFRLMRPLRSLTTMPTMKVLIGTLLESVTQLGGVMLLTMFFFMVFSILGVSIWSGKIFYRCRLTEFPINGDWEADPEDRRICSDVRQCPQHRWCGSLAEASRSTDPRMYIDPLKLIDTTKYKNAASSGSCQCDKNDDWIEGFGVLDLTSLYTQNKYKDAGVCTCADHPANWLGNKGALTSELCGEQCWSDKNCTIFTSDPGVSCDLYSQDCLCNNDTNKETSPNGPNPKQKKVIINRVDYTNFCTDRCYSNPKCVSFILEEAQLCDLYENNCECNNKPDEHQDDLATYTDPVTGELLINATAIVGPQKFTIERNYKGIWRDTMINELNYGYSNFNHLFSAFLTIFQCTTMEGWIDISNMFDDAYSPAFVKIYFLLVIIICSLFILNLTIAVMLLKHEELDKSGNSSAHLDDLVELGKEIKLPELFVEFLIEQEGISISQKGLKILKSQKQESFWKQLLKSNVTYDKEDSYYNYKITRLCFYIQNSPIWDGFIMLIIMLNTVVLALNKDPQWDDSINEFFDNTNTVFTIIFTFEVIVKTIGIGTRAFCSDQMNLFDALIVVVSIIEMIMETISIEEGSGGGGAFSALRAFRLGRIFKMFKGGDLRNLLNSIVMTIRNIYDYSILLALFIYVMSLLGMSQFAGKVKFDDHNEVDLVNGEAPRSNFDTFGWAVVTVFEIMIGENWNAMMYDHMRAMQNDFVAIYFVMMIILGNIIMLNLFLAILLSNFDRQRSKGEKEKIFNAFGSLLSMGYKLNIAIAYLFDDQDFTRHIEDKVLKAKDEEGAQESKKKAQGLGDDEDPEYTEKEIKLVFIAMQEGFIEKILTGEMELGSELTEAQNKKVSMNSSQRERTLEILAYIKRQDNLRKQRFEFQEQLRRNEEIREALDREDNDDDFLSSESEDSAEPKTWLELILDHIQNSSLLLFPQNSNFRNMCQKCLQADDDDVPSTKQIAEQPSAVSSGAQDQSMFGVSPNNKIGNLDENEIESSVPQNPKRLRQAKSQQVKNTQQMISLAPSNDMLKTQKQKLASTSTLNNSKSIIKKSAGNKNKNVTAKIFEGIILFLIFISSITLVIDNPLADPESGLIIFVGYLDNCFTVLFTIEAFVKIAALGFLFNNATLREKGFLPYIRNPWNIIDLVVVVASLVDLIVTLKTLNDEMKIDSTDDQNEEASIASSLQSLKALRALRALRPLKMISRNPGMKLIVTSLLSSLPSMTNVTIVCTLFLLIFAIMGVDTFSGTFGSCTLTDPDELKTLNILSKADCEKYGYEWYTPPETFDNTLIGFRTLFEMMSTEGWIDVMNNGIDGVSKKGDMYMQPQEDNSPIVVFYFIVFMIFGSQFILNLFVGVIMDNFNKIKEKEELGSLFVTPEQRCWIDAHRFGLTKKLQKQVAPPTGWRGKFFRIVNHKVFEGMITFFIAFNTIVMAIKFDGMSPDFENTLDKLNYLFAGIFNMEMYMKLIGLGTQYFYSAWNLFDMTVVIGTDIGLILEFTTDGSGFSTAATVVRAFRIMRIVRLVRSQPSIKIILDTVVNIIPQISNFITLLFLLLFIFSALGINLFGGCVYQEFINEKANFDGIGNAIITLFRCSTGEDWNKIMHELTIYDPLGIQCINDQDYSTYIKNGKEPMQCGQLTSIPFFILFTIVIAWLIMNLSVAAVIEGLENAKQQNSGVIEGDDVQALLDGWMEYDPEATGWIDILDFVCLIIELPSPFGNKYLTPQCQFSQKDFQKAKNLIYNHQSYFINEKRRILIKNKDVLNILASYKIQTYQGKTNRVHFKDIYQILVKRAFMESVDDFEISKYLKTKMKTQWMDKHKKLKELPKTGFKAHQGYASNIITGYAKNFRKRKQQKIEDNLKKSLIGGLGFVGNISKKPNDTIQQSAKSPHLDGVDQEQDEQQEALEMFDDGLKKLKGVGNKNVIPDDSNDDEGEDDPMPSGQKTTAAGLPDIHLGRNATLDVQKRVKNRDENPQEFEEVGSLEEQSQGRAIEQIIQNRAAIARDDHPISDHSDSMLASAQKLEFNIKMGQSITNSVAGQSDSNMDLLSPNNNEEGLMIQNRQIESQHQIQSNKELEDGDNLKVNGTFQSKEKQDRQGSNNRSRGGERPQTGGFADGGQGGDEVLVGEIVQTYPKTPDKEQIRPKKNAQKPELQKEFKLIKKAENIEAVEAVGDNFKSNGSSSPKNKPQPKQGNFL